MKQPLLQSLRTSLKRSSHPTLLNRDFIAGQYINGTGIEIGALHNPLPVNLQHAKVQYVDRMGVDQLRKQYPELEGLKMIPVDIITDGELLENIPEGTQDFVIANHFLEHCQNPVLTIQNMLRVLKQGGIIFLAVPDKRYTFDKARPSTSVQHLLDDFRKGPAVSREGHFREWSELVQHADTEEEIDKMTKQLMKMDYSIHFHVWEKTDMDEFLIFLIKIMSFSFEMEVSLRVPASNENLYILRKL